MVFCSGERPSSSNHLIPGVRSAASRVLRRILEVAMEGRWPPAGGGSVPVELQRRVPPSLDNFGNDRNDD
jgi:hypothetical protein